MNWNAETATLARSNYFMLRRAGIVPERAYPDADRWASFDVEVRGHTYRDAKLFIQLQSTRPGAEPYEQEFHL
jgi:hypothetical protein